MIYDVTGNDFLARSADTVITSAMAIVLIVVLSLVARWLAHRVINQVVEGAVKTRIPRLHGIARLRLPRRREQVAVAEPDDDDKAGNGTVVVTTPRREQRARTIGSVLRSLSSIVILTIGSIMVLAEFGVNLGPILASAGIVGVAVGFGAQNLVRDFLSGVFMLLEDQYGVGDVIDVGAAIGTVETVGLRITTIRDGNGTLWYVRNGEIMRVGNKSQGYAVATVDIPLAHNADLAKAADIAGRVATERLAAADLAEHALEAPEILGAERIGPEGVTFRVTVKTGAGQQYAVQRALIAALTDAFEKAGLPSAGALPGPTLPAPATARTGG
ncbi:mechanosensitive ion channel protein MscS [Pseudonocardia sp. CNS-139]|nr:mechanosensitive ion channel protein MscS [Pseudonocardia sp. CNS-139]